MFARHLSRLLLGRLREGRVEVVDGERAQAFGPADAPLAATVRAGDERFMKALPRGSLALADTYADGAWDSDDLVALVRIGARELPRLDRFRRMLAPLRNALTRIPRNTRAGARRHIAAHYDLGNDMFRTFLDDTMTYSCAYFESPEVTLREAQEAKLERICRKLELRPDDHVVEIGTGWGSFAMHAAGRYGCRVTTTTISREQHALATQRVREAGLDDRVTVVLEDYRDLRGRFDKLVSIEMIEAVGWQYFDTFFRRCAELLRPTGLMLLQAITIEDRFYELEKASRSFIKQLIFPAGCLPSVEVIRRSAARVTDMRMLDLEDITEHYPETLRRWRQNFVSSAERVTELGYDLRFRRLWELYFAWCEGGFRERRIGDVQALFAKPSYRGSGSPLQQTKVLAQT
ncbi:MAG TPA: cyclopropane-fatty-acyl-phospholipid synthase family protein [Thermoleophilaceae bacterium]|nr:cyclopropane-fatty-acyl-phospholipid synthase family protein [Thermoleophilaceae bacterium]